MKIILNTDDMFRIRYFLKRVDPNVEFGLEKLECKGLSVVPEAGGVIVDIKPECFIEYSELISGMMTPLKAIYDLMMNLFANLEKDCTLFHEKWRGPVEIPQDKQEDAA